MLCKYVIYPKILSHLKSLHMILTYFIASNISWRLTFMTVSFRIFIRNSWLLIGHDTAVWETKMKGNENHIHSSSVTDEFLIYFINQRCPNAHHVSLQNSSSKNINTIDEVSISVYYTRTMKISQRHKRT